MSTLSRGLLAFAAGFVDTATFVHVSGLFAAHVTGNFVLFAAALSRGVAAEDFLKLLTFPVFVIAVLLGTVIHERASRRAPAGAYLRVLGVEGALLLGVGLVALLVALARGSTDLGTLDVALSFVLVVAMGLQNSVHRFVPGPMTTVMTGNVTQLTALVGAAVFGREPAGAKEHAAPAPWTPTVVLLLGFAAGCVASAVATAAWGLATALACGVLVIASVVLERRPPAGEAK